MGCHDGPIYVDMHVVGPTRREWQAPPMEMSILYSPPLKIHIHENPMEGCKVGYVHGSLMNGMCSMVGPR